MPSKEEIITLLEIDPASNESEYLLKTARDMAHTITSNTAYLWGAIGIDFAKCHMNCKFCSFGESWDIVKDEYSLNEDEIISQVAEYAASGVYYIVLRTTEFYDIEKLKSLVKKIRAKVPGTYELILNTGEFDITIASQLYRTGVDGSYHAIRLREGVDTSFNPLFREKTLDAIHRSPLKLIHLIEPIGPEHTSREIAERFITSVNYGVFISGVMARIPVKGTPYENTERISTKRIAHITAVLRIAGGYTVPNICVHPASREAIHAGANIVVVEKGAIPRDDKLSKNMWHNFTADIARKLLNEEGYVVHPQPLQSDTTDDSINDISVTAENGSKYIGSSLERFVQPAIMSLLLDNYLTAYQIRQKLMNYSMFCNRPPDMTGIYRYTKLMEERNLLEKKVVAEQSNKTKTIYAITPTGRKHLREWISVMEKYRSDIDTLINEISGIKDK